MHQIDPEHATLRGFLEAAPDAAIAVDELGEILLVNSLAERMFGYGGNELIGRRIEVLVPKRYQERHVADRQRYSAGPRTRPMGEGQDLTGVRKDGTEFPVEISLSPLQTGTTRLVISIIRDVTQRRQAEARFRGLLESAPDGIVVVDARGNIAIVNTQAERMFGYRRDELIGKPIEVLVPGAAQRGHLAQRDGYFRNPRTRPMGAGRALTGRKKGGAEFPVEISLSPLETEHGLLVTSIIRDITDRRRVEEQIAASLREKEVLLKEIHHRVKNNLQVTSSLLKLQSQYVEDPRSKALFAESQNRIRSMALVHEKLYQSSDLSRIDFVDYVQTLAALLFRSSAIDPERIELQVEGGPVYFIIETAVPCGLIVNELLSNALKHAFPGNRKGRIVVSLREDDTRRIVLSVRDDGVGLPPALDPDDTSTLGLQLVRTLAGQVRAELEVRRGEGTEFRLRFAETRT